MRKHEQIEILVNHLADNANLFISYLNTVLENRDNRFWSLNEEIKAFKISYSHDDLNIYCSIVDEDLDGCDENEEISFFYELYVEKTKLDEGYGFLPNELQNIELDLELYDRLEEWIFYCWKVARPLNFPLPAFLDNYDSASYYKNLDDGEKGDHIYVMDILDPDDDE